MARLTVAEARARANQWKAMRDERDRTPHADYFREASPHELIAMWETGKRKDGRKLNDWEYACLIEAWCQCFGGMPAGADFEAKQPSPEATAMPVDDTVLRMPEVERLTGLSVSTIKRMVSDGRFPKPLRLGVRAKGWLAADVRGFIERLVEQRKQPRQ